MTAKDIQLALVRERYRQYLICPNYTPANYPEAHFATFPPDLIKPCILAGSRAGDIVLDPFGGSGTTGATAMELGRRAILCELNADYCKLADHRTNVTPGLAI